MTYCLKSKNYQCKAIILKEYYKILWVSFDFSLISNFYLIAIHISVLIYHVKN